MLLLSMITERELPAQELIELAKRVQIPGYEAVHELVHDAVIEGVIAPSISSGFYLRCEIWDVLEWAKYRTSAKTSQCWLPEFGASLLTKLFRHAYPAGFQFRLLGSPSRRWQILATPIWVFSVTVRAPFKEAKY
jgi:hypothetical protein